MTALALRYGLPALLVVAVVFALFGLGWKFGSERTEAHWQTEWSKRDAVEATARAEAVQVARTEEQRRFTAAQQVVDDARKQTTVIDFGVSDLSVAVDGLRFDAAEQYVPGGDFQHRHGRRTRAVFPRLVRGNAGPTNLKGVKPMIPDISLAAGAWHDLYAASGFTPGTPLLVYNKGSSAVFLWEGATEPAQVGHGATLLDVPTVISQSGVTGCWVNSMGGIRLCVQAYTP